jgi:hypothetical protein
LCKIIKSAFVYKRDKKLTMYIKSWNVGSYNYGKNILETFWEISNCFYVQQIVLGIGVSFLGSLDTLLGGL